jgi:hypothetical protein
LQIYSPHRRFLFRKVAMRTMAPTKSSSVDTANRSTPALGLDLPLAAVILSGEASGKVEVSYPAGETPWPRSTLWIEQVEERTTARLKRQ